MLDKTPGRMPEVMADRIPDKVPDNLSGNMSDGMLTYARQVKFQKICEILSIERQHRCVCEIDVI